MKKNTDLNNYDNPGSSTATSSNLLYLLIGGGIGATLALLFAPKSGSALRRDIGDYTQKGYDQSLELAGKLRDQSTQLYGAVREKADQVYGMAADKLHLGSGGVGEMADNAMQQGKQLGGDVLENGAMETGSETGGSRPGNIH